MAEYGLLIPFLDQDPKYVLGVEFGMLYERLRALDVGQGLSDMVTADNQEQLTLTCNRLKLTIVEMSDVADVEGWINFTLRRDV